MIKIFIYFRFPDRISTVKSLTSQLLLTLPCLKWVRLLGGCAPPIAHVMKRTRLVTGSCRVCTANHSDGRTNSDHDIMNAKTKAVEMDEAFKKVGEFGRLQKKLLVWFNLFQLVAAFNMLMITFVGRSPVWNCSKTAATDGKLMCHMFETGKCKPVYSQNFTSIVSEVSMYV